MAHHKKGGAGKKHKKRNHRHWDESKTGRGRAARVHRKRQSRKSASKRGNWRLRSTSFAGKGKKK